MRKLIVLVTFIFVLVSTNSMAAEADVLFAELTRSFNGTYYIDATVKHQDTGWDHYASWWRVKTKDGDELARRVLAHPHVEEQPFTRGQSNIKIPDGINFIIIEAHDMIHKYGGKTITVDLGKTIGEGYRIIK
jgi:hypothetical protein